MEERSDPTSQIAERRICTVISAQSRRGSGDELEDCRGDGRSDRRAGGSEGGSGLEWGRGGGGGGGERGGDSD